MRCTSRLLLLGGALAGLLLCSPASSFEVETHEELSEAAVLQSTLPEYLPIVGLTSLDDELVSTRFGGGSPRFGGGSRSVIEWVRFGANHEDDFFSDEFARFRHHFYNPLPGAPNNGALTHPLVPVGLPAPTWALEDQAIGDQDFSLRDARDYLYAAMTETSEPRRDENLALVFRTLGHVIHLVQDSAQPQHTRNDSHGGFFFGARSVYELYTNNNRFDPARVPLGGYDRVGAGPAGSFWHTGDRRGMADFSNRNFVSVNTNFRGSIAQGLRPHPNFPDPSGADARIESLPIEDPSLLGPTQPLRGIIKFIGTGVTDAFTGDPGLFNSRTSTESIFDPDLEDRLPVAIHSLNRFNYDAANRFLIPRAVGYSAGLIDYFLRGRVEAVAAEFTSTGVSLRVRNAIDTERFPEWQNEALHGADGEFVLTLRYTRNGIDTFATSPPVSFATPQALDPGQISAETLSFTLATPPDDATEVEYRLVFRGRLGDEDDAVVVGLVEIDSGFIVSPSYLPDDGIQGSRLVVRTVERWRLADDTGLVAGNIDWKGWYRHGRATKVLTWKGPASRSFAGLGFSERIFENGEALALAPRPVLGAALHEDAAGAVWIIAIVRGNTDTVYRRPYAKSDSAALFDPVTNPDGWQELGRFDEQPDFSHRAWFFNGDGTEAQTMRRSNDTFLNGLTRAKVEIDGASATFSILGNLAGATGPSSLVGICSDELKNEGECSGTSSNPTGSKTSHRLITADKSVTLNRAGGYVIAVDYIDDREVTATLTSSDVDIPFDTLDRNERDSFQVCYKDGSDDVFVRGSSTIDGFDSSATSKSLSVMLNSEKIGDFVVHEIQNSAVHDARFFQDCPDMQFLGDISSCVAESEITHTVVETERKNRIDYLDLRHGLLSVASEAVEREYRARRLKEFVGNNELVSDTGFVVSVGEQTKTTGHSLVVEGRTTEIVSFSETAPFTGIVPDLHPSRGPDCGDDISGELPALLILPVGNDVFRPKGSWAVDTRGNVFVSQESQDESGTIRYFNLLTDGDPESILRTAPDDARYFPIFVVK